VGVLALVAVGAVTEPPALLALYALIVALVLLIIVAILRRPR
jgi:hypothetical protein